VLNGLRDTLLAQHRHKRAQDRGADMGEWRARGGCCGRKGAYEQVPQQSRRLPRGCVARCVPPVLPQCPTRDQAP
jgi:TnpA family transposase